MIHHTEEEADELTEMYGQFFDDDGQARTEEPIPIAKLVQLFRTSDPRIRSRVARMVGKYSQYQAFVARRLQEDDPRVRANAIESLWGVDTPVARRALEAAASDSHHRARINAIYGLYVLGNAASIRLLIKQTKHYSASFRAAAVWAMGQTADPRFLGVVREMSEDPDSAVKQVSALSAARIEEKLKAERKKPTFRASILRARGPDPEWRALTMLLPRDIGDSVKATDFLIEENGQTIVTYEVEHLTAQLPLRIGIAISETRPNSTWVADAEAALRPHLSAATRRDAFAIVRYSAFDRKTSYTTQGLRAIYATKPELVQAQLAVQVPSGNLQEAVTELAGSLFGPEADRALLLFVETDPAGAEAARCCPPAELAAGLRAKNVPLHIITTADGEGGPLEAACAAMGGIFAVAPSREALQQACNTVLSSISERFEIKYLSEKSWEPGSSVKITIYSRDAWAEDTRALL